MQLRIFSLLLAITLITAAACKKPFVYTIVGIQDTSLTTDGGLLNLSITARGNNQMVYLSIDSLPSFVTATITPASGMPPFTAVVRLTGSNFSPYTWGTYTLRLHSKSDGSNYESYLFNVHYAPVDADSFFTGGFSAHDSCDSIPSFQYHIGAAATVIKNQLQLTNFYNSGLTVSGLISPLTHTITIPQQYHAALGDSIKGTGTISTDTTLPQQVYMTYLFTDTTGTIVEVCNGVWLY